MIAFTALQRGTQVLVPARFVPGLSPDAPAIPGVVLDTQTIASTGPGALALVNVAVNVPGARQTQPLVLSEPGGLAAQFDFTPVNPAAAQASLWGGERGAGWPVTDAK